MRLFVKLLFLLALAATLDYTFLRPFRLTQQIEQEASRPITATELSRLTGRPLATIDPTSLPR